MKRIIIHGLKQDYRSFVAAVQGWPTQPTLAEFENLLASQEALAKQLGSVSINPGSTQKTDAEALYVNNRPKGKSRYKGHSHKSARPNKSEAQSRRWNEADNIEPVDAGNNDRKPKFYGKHFPFNCHNCGRKGHMAKDCRSKRSDEGNSAIIKEEEDWDVQALAAHVEEAYTVTTADK
jgi:hypothetical protein